jgi:hypothetical protein
LNGYMLYRKHDKTAVVILCENDDELFYFLKKIGKSRFKVLKELSNDMMERFFAESFTKEEI